jgi:hypothetical protein
VAAAHSDILDLLITASGQLPDDECRRARQAQHDYIAEWTRLLAMVEPGTDSSTHRIRIQAALTVINDTARTRHLVDAIGYPTAMRVIARQLVFGIAEG